MAFPYDDICSCSVSSVSHVRRVPILHHKRSSVKVYGLKFMVLVSFVYMTHLRKILNWMESCGEWMCEGGSWLSALTERGRGTVRISMNVKD